MRRPENTARTHINVNYPSDADDEHLGLERCKTDGTLHTKFPHCVNQETGLTTETAQYVGHKKGGKEIRA